MNIIERIDNFVDMMNQNDIIIKCIMERSLIDKINLKDNELYTRTIDFIFEIKLSLFKCEPDLISKIKSKMIESNKSHLLKYIDDDFLN